MVYDTTFINDIFSIGHLGKFIGLLIKKKRQFEIFKKLCWGTKNATVFKINPNTFI